MAQKTPKFALSYMIVFAILLICAAVFWSATLVFVRSETNANRAQLSLYQSTLNAGLKRYAHLPSVLSQDPFVIAAAEGQGRAALNMRLEDFALNAELEAIYLMDLTGLTVSASNHGAAQTFLGKNYGFRPYFQQAADGDLGQFFAIGATTGRPGYFLSAPVRSDSHDIVGVIAIKVDLSSLGASWAEDTHALYVKNADGVVVLTSRPEWRYKTVGGPAQIDLEKINAARQFGSEVLQPLDVSQGILGPKINGDAFIETSTPLDVLGWTLYHLTPAWDVWRKVALTLLSVLIAMAIAGAVWLWIRSRRIGAALRASQEDRRKLRSANHRLEREIDVRRKAEAKLEDAQKELRHTSKLAALGQLSASVTHELGQPLSALKTHITAAEIKGDSDAGLLAKLGGLVHRMEAITTDLRFFAKLGNDAFETIDLNTVVIGAVETMRPQIEMADITLKINATPDPIWVAGNVLRLEQVVVNLLSNAKTALKTSATKIITVTLDPKGALRVVDSGLGLGGRSMEDLAEPFHTTQASGDGMGLGLAISSEIMRDHAGSLRVIPSEIGAAFEMSLPLTAAQQKAS